MLLTSIADKLNTALEHHQSGDLDRAEGLYREILRVDSRHADALHLLGVAAHQRDEHKVAVDYIGRAIAVNRLSATYYCNLGAAKQALGEIEAAVEIFREAIRIAPESWNAWYNLGNVLRLQGKLDDAQAAYRRAIALNPHSAAAHNNLGGVSNEQHEFEEAVAAFQRAVAIDPNYAQAHHNLGNALQEQGNLEEAVLSYQRAIAIQPDYAEAFSNLATAFQEQGGLEQAVVTYRQALQLDPARAEIHNNLGTALSDWGKLDEALASFCRAVAINPAYAEAHNNLGNVLKGREQFDEAVVEYERAVDLKPDFAEAHSNLSALLQTEGRMEPAAEHLKRAIRVNPSNGRRVKLATMLPPLYKSMSDLLEWRQRLGENVERLLEEGLTVDPAVELIPTNFYLAYQGFDDRALVEKINRLYRSSHVPELEPARRRRPTDGRIRVAFISKNFRNHTIGGLMRGLIAELSRDEFHVTVLSLFPHRDEVSSLIRRDADAFVELSEQPSVAIRRIVEEQFDVLFYADIGMDPITYSLAHSRLAPVQCVTWGHPVTTGLKTIDYFVSSELLEPAQAQKHYTEQLVELKTMPTYYSRPKLPSELRGRDDYGLPNEGHLYVCPQSLFKLHPEFDALLAGILEKDAQGFVVFLEGLHSYWTECLRDRFRRSIPDALRQRIFFVPRQSYGGFLNLLAISDVMLDPIHFGGGNTCYEAAAFGIPNVTLPSPFMRGRGAWSLYNKMGISDTVAETPEEYVDVAVKLGTDRTYRAAVHERILASADCLFEEREAVEELERFLRQAVAGRFG